MSGEPQRYWGAVAARWAEDHPDVLWRRCSDYIHRAWLDRVAGDLRGQLVLKTDLFDEAVGDGLAGWFIERDNRLVGCDISWATASRASRHAPDLRATAADVCRLPFRAGAFDCVCSNSTLDHFDDEALIRQALGELARVLRPGGLLLVSFDNPSNPLIWLRGVLPRFWSWTGIVPYTVGVTCSGQRLDELLADAGFVTVGQSTFMHVPRVVAVVGCRMLHGIGGVASPPAYVRRWLDRFERLAHGPWPAATGHFVAAVARRTS
jgi:SAM-dependent methyltransferase